MTSTYKAVSDHDATPASEQSTLDKPVSCEPRRATADTVAVEAFVERTTSASGVPALVEDSTIIEQIARVLS